MRDTLYILRVGDKHAAHAPSEYYRKHGTVVYFRRESGRIIAVQTSITFEPVEITTELGKSKTLLADQTNRKIGQATIIGMQTLTESFGEVPEKPVPFYVFK